MPVPPVPLVPVILIPLPPAALTSIVAWAMLTPAASGLPLSAAPTRVIEGARSVMREPWLTPNTARADWVAPAAVPVMEMLLVAVRLPLGATVE